MGVVSYPRRLADLAAAGPDRPAVTCGDDTLTRAELEARADRLARHLRRRGVTTGDMVTIALPNSVEWVVAVVAAWKLGAIPQPVSPRLPARELQAIIDLAQPTAVLGPDSWDVPAAANAAAAEIDVPAAEAKAADTDSTAADAEAEAVPADTHAEAYEADSNSDDTAETDDDETDSDTVHEASTAATTTDTTTENGGRNDSDDDRSKGGSRSDAGPLPDVVSPAWKAPTSGGSTGRPKLIVAGDPAQIDTDEPPGLRLQPDGCMVMPGPLFHNGPIVWSMRALLWGNHVVLLPRFDAAETLRLIAAHHADIVYVVPTMMKRISALPDEERLAHDLTSLRSVWHLAEPCPPWLKQEWIDWLGPDTIMELYAGTEAQVATVISGREWLEHRGSVGRPLGGEITVLDAEGEPVPPGTVGEVWLRSGREAPTYRYVGAEARAREGGWESLGDLGWLDDDGYLYLADRMQDMILSGGANIYPAEVEAAILEHPAVRSCAVIGLPDDDLGSRAHAIVEADPDAVEFGDLADFVRERLVAYKVPRSWELVQESLRDDAGKVRRVALRAARLPS